MRISEALLTSFQSARHLKEAGARVNAIDFHAKADVLVEINAAIMRGLREGAGR